MLSKTQTVTTITKIGNKILLYPHNNSIFVVGYSSYVITVNGANSTHILFHDVKYL